MYYNTRAKINFNLTGNVFKTIIKFYDIRKHEILHEIRYTSTNVHTETTRAICKITPIRLSPNTFQKIYLHIFSNSTFAAIKIVVIF